MKLINITILIISLISLSACEALKYRKTDAREFPPDPKERVKKNIEEGRGFRIMGGVKDKGTSYSFSTSNPLWRATLDTLDFMPLVSANYSGGIVVTDWYSENNSPEESIKISIRFLSNEIRSDALSIKVFYKNCSLNETCQVTDRSSSLSDDLEKKILNKAAVYRKSSKEKKKKKYLGEIK